MRPSWLRVDSAITFLRLVSEIALQLAKKAVKDPKSFRISKFSALNGVFLIRYTPLVTRVDEWTKALTGVGAAMALGSQAQKGICALFVIDPKTINPANRVKSIGCQ